MEALMAQPVAAVEPAVALRLISNMICHVCKSALHPRPLQKSMLSSDGSPAWVAHCNSWCSAALTNARVWSLLLGLEEVQDIVSQDFFSSGVCAASELDGDREAGAGNCADVGLPYGLQICPLP